jgi:hypothetical protein
MHGTPAGLPAGIPGIGVEMLGAMQQAAQPERQFITKFIPEIFYRALRGRQPARAECGGRDGRSRYGICSTMPGRRSLSLLMIPRLASKIARVFAAVGVP